MVVRPIEIRIGHEDDHLVELLRYQAADRTLQLRAVGVRLVVRQQGTP